MPLIPHTHQLILDSSEPLHVLQYCRTMTLAQGRILYQLWDEWELWPPQHRGYIVPRSVVAQVASTLKARGSFGLYSMLTRHAGSCSATSRMPSTSICRTAA